MACGGCRPTAAGEPPRLQFDGLDVRAFAASRLTSRLLADRLVIEPKRAGLLEVSALSELVLVRPRLELSAPPRGAAAGPVGGLPTALPLLGLGRTRHLVAATFYAPSLRFLRDGEPVAQVDADRGTARAGADEVVLHGFRLTHRASGRSVSARRAVWNVAGATFWIAGDAVVRDGDRRFGVHGVRLDAEADPLAARGR
jgi:hypothetical protein